LSSAERTRAPSSSTRDRCMQRARVEFGEAMLCQGSWQH